METANEKQSKSHEDICGLQFNSLTKSAKKMGDKLEPRFPPVSNNTKPPQVVPPKRQSPRQNGRSTKPDEELPKKTPQEPTAAELEESTDIVVREPKVMTTAGSLSSIRHQNSLKGLKNVADTTPPSSIATTGRPGSDAGSQFSRDNASVRSWASVGMGSTDGKKMIIRRVPTTPVELFNIVNPPT